MEKWPHTFEGQNLHIGYFPGSGGHRLHRLILGHQWATQSGDHNHNNNGIEELSRYESGMPKCPVPYFADPESNIMFPTKSFISPSKILLSHCMHVPLTKQIFPNRVAVKIYANLHHSLRRWWVIFGKNFNSAKTDPVIMLPMCPTPMGILEYTIKSHVDYYTKFMDAGHDHAMYLIAGHSEFADFMLEEFEIIRDHPAADEFDQCWRQITTDLRWRFLMQNPMLLDPAFCQKQHKYFD
jgi:hypothetical protein